MAVIASGSLSTLASGCGGYGTTGCFDKREGESCPTDEEEIVARMRQEGSYQSEGNENCESIDGADEEPFEQAGQCCYEIDVSGPGLMGCGRPFVEQGRARVASPGREAGWSAGVRRPAELSPALSRAVGRAWAREAFAEHASVASFARFSLELLALGAPAELVAAAHRAALDEVRHARLCFALAARYLKAPVAPGPLPMGERVAVSSDPAEVAARLAVEGCIGETASAVVLAEQRRSATDPAARRVLSVLARDERRHAELAWRTLAWLTRHRDARVVDAVAKARAMHAGWRPGHEEVSLPSHGRLGAEAIALVLRTAQREIIEPCFRAVAA